MAEASAVSKPSDQPEMIANRYRVEQTLGRGGMGTVYKVLDTSNYRHVALKCLRTWDDPEAQQRAVNLFEHEYHTLSLLSHPRVVAVYDYGKDDLVPYYTMELLEGGDLRQLSPLPWPKVCELLSDICSALSLLHSRRLVHRDLTPNNIRCTQDRQAKLFDFGAMVPFGSDRLAVGTPHFIAPEAFLCQFVDGRTDLFSLGATAYFALTERHAYPNARSLTSVRDAWRTKPLPPSHYVPEIPGELDQLIIALVRLDPTTRPASAAEVMEKLSGIAGLSIDERLVVRQAYLSSPTLVGRDDLALRARKQVVRAMRGRGGIMMITGAAGAGRSRVLDAYAMEGKLAGATVLRANAADGADGPWGGARALVRQLIDEIPAIALPAAASYAPVLGHIVPEIFDRLEATNDPAARGQQGSDNACGIAARCSNRPSVRPVPSPGSLAALKGFDTPLQRRAALQNALCGWLVDVSRRRCLMVAVDDIHRVDEPSTAWVALLSRYASDHCLVVVVTAESEAPTTSERALALLTEAGARIKLKNLSLEDTGKLLDSIFGEAPNLRLVTDRLHAASAGNPGTILQLARHLLDQGLVSYQGGTWILPSRIDAQDLPYSLSETFKARLRNVNARALELAQTIALCAKPSFDFNDCLALTSHQNTGQLLSDLNELAVLEILFTEGDYYGLKHASWRAALTDELGRETAKTFHLRLAQLLETRSPDPLSPAYHLIRADRTEQALDLVIERVSAFRAHLSANPTEFLAYVQSLPPDWADTAESLLQACTALGRPRMQWFVLLSHMYSCAAVIGEVRQAYLKELIEQLYHDCGLDLYHELDDALEPSVRLERALTLAQKRFDATPESERVLPPFEAIPELAQAIVQAIGVLSNAADFQSFGILPSLVPLLPLSPALGVVQKNVEGSLHNLAGRNPQARKLWLEVIDRIDQEDHAGLDESLYAYSRLAIIYVVGVIDVLDGLNSSTQWIDQLEKNPLFEVNAWRLRMLLALNQGDAQQAELCKKRVELLQIQNCPPQMFEAFMTWDVFLGYAAFEDLVQVKLAITEFEAIARRHPGWNLCVHCARGVYHQIRGDLSNALREFESALALTPPARYQAWGPIVGGYATALLNLGRASEARQIAEEALKIAEQEELGIFFKRYIQQPFALAEATLKHDESAVKHADAVIAALDAGGATGVVLGSAYETRARVAVLTMDHVAFDTYATLCANRYLAGGNPALTAKYEKLKHDARRAGIGVASDVTRVANEKELRQQVAESLATALGECQGPQQRARKALELLLKESGAEGGLLYTLQKSGPVLAAQAGQRRPPARIDAFVVDYLSAELEDVCEVTVTEVDIADQPLEERCWRGPDGHRFIPCILAHQSDTSYTITGVLVLCEDVRKKLKMPYGLIQALSWSLRDAGDVVTAIAAA
jgi:tetratricopeptide (TPR) repeat protein